MGIFSKRKNVDSPASVLSESEIQKKLYGEFKPDEKHTITRDRESFDPSAVSARTPDIVPGKEAPLDLFDTSKGVSSGSGLSFHEGSSRPKPADQAPRYVPLQNFEKKSSSSSEVDPYSRFRYNRPQENRMATFLGWANDLFGKLGELLKVFLDPKHGSLRKPFYWGGGILIVVFLFLGVNALNSQREEAMRERYKLRGEVTPAEVPVQTPQKFAPPSTPNAEREVVITPAPVKPKKLPTATATVTPKTPSGGPFMIQVVTYPTRQDADQIVGTLGREGFQAFVKEDTRPTGRILYVVLIGGFRSEAEAQAQLLKFRAKEVARPFQDAFVRSSRA